MEVENKWKVIDGISYPQDSNSKQTLNRVVRTLDAFRVERIEVKSGINPNKIPDNFLKFNIYRKDAYDIDE